MTNEEQINSDRDTLTQAQTLDELPALHGRQKGGLLEKL